MLTEARLPFVRPALYELPLGGHWSGPPPIAGEPLAAARGAVQGLIDAGPAPPSSKGEPDIPGIKRAAARALREALPDAENDDDATWREALSRARHLAVLDVAEPASFAAWVNLTAAANADALAAARVHLRRHVVMHLSCTPRLDRARASCASFGPLAAADVAQVTVVGRADATRFSFDPASGVLEVPEPDSYEHLPAKVLAALSFFALAGNVRAVLKVDDDLRLHDATAVREAWSRLDVRRPLQAGLMNDIVHPGNHMRSWHFGKCSDAVLNVRPYSWPGPVRWVNGAGGYLLNHAALRVLLWSYVHFADYVYGGLYEDMMVSDLLERHGGRLLRQRMSNLVSTVSDY